MESCFKLVGYPEWYSNLKGKSQPKLAAHVQETRILGHSPLDFDNRVNFDAATGMDSVMMQNLLK